MTLGSYLGDNAFFAFRGEGFDGPALARTGSVREVLASALIEVGEAGQAVALLARAPGARRLPSLGLAEARARRAAGDHHGAVETFRSLSHDDPRVREAAPEFERLEAALSSLEQSARWLAREPESLTARIERSLALAAAGLPNESAREAQVALQKHPTSRAALLLAARQPGPEFWHPELELVEKDGLTIASASARQQLADLSKLDEQAATGNSTASTARARLLLALRQPKLALADATETRTPNGLLARVEVLAALGHGREASALAAHAEARDKKLAAKVWTFAAEAFLNAWEPARAEAAASRAISLGHADGSTYELRARARQRLNDEEGSREDLAASRR